MGRPIKLTSDVQEEICRATRIGAKREIAARAAGISESTFYGWVARGKAERERLQRPRTRPRKRETPFLEFLEALERAEAKGEVTHLETIADDGSSGSKWILSRRHPERWAPTTKQEVSGPGGEAIQVKSVREMTYDELCAIIGPEGE